MASLYEDGLGRAPSAADLQVWSASSPSGVLFGVAASAEATAHQIQNV